MLLPHFAFTSFATELNLASVESRYAKPIDAAAEQKPPDGGRSPT
jgi:hypothetical protein